MSRLVPVKDRVGKGYFAQPSAATLVERLLADKRSEHTKKAYAKDLKDFFRTTTGREPTAQMVTAFLGLERAEAKSVVLNEINTSFDRGEFVVLLGNSGSGKSTLLNLISGIEKPTGGSILINDVPITQLNERERTLFRRDHIGFVFQFFNLIPTLAVLENVTLPQELAGHNRKEVEQKALNLLDRVGLADRCQAFPDKLSGGQQQRVAIARALIHDPMLVLADEPTGNLDEETGDRVLKLLLDLTRSANKTLIMATHNPEIAKLADRVFRVHDGHLEELIQAEPIEEVAV